MRVKIDFETKRNCICSDYRGIFISMLKQAFQSYSQDLYERYYASNNVKDLCFSIKLSRPKFEKDTIILGNNKICMYLSVKSCDDMEVGSALVNATSKQLSRKISEDNELHFVSFSFCEDTSKVNIMTDKVTFSILSPICLRNHDKSNNKNDTYVSCVDENFKENLMTFIKRDLIENAHVKLYILSNLDKVTIDTSECRKTIVKHYGYTFPVTIGKLTMSGDSNILDIIYKRNIGSKRSAGFGFITIDKRGE